MLRVKPEGVGLASYTPSTSAPSSVRRRAMMSPMSPLPRMTQRRVGSSPSRFVKFCAVPAVNTPAGRVPWMKTCFAVRSRQPVASTSVRVSSRATPSRLTV